MLLAAMCLCFFGFLHAGEAVAPDYSDFNPTQNLTYVDIAIDNMSKPTYLQVNKKQSKTGPFGLDVKVIVERTVSSGSSLKLYMTLRGPISDPLSELG